MVSAAILKIYNEIQVKIKHVVGFDGSKGEEK